jgi:hypothetical protein
MLNHYKGFSPASNLTRSDGREKPAVELWPKVHESPIGNAAPHLVTVRT